MPHAVYLDPWILCPWSGCTCRIELVDFQLELSGDTAFYARVMKDWGSRPGYGLVGRCPGCRKYVRFGVTDKQPVDDPNATGLPVLPDDWHLNAYLA
jgi:hypothetical protein